MKQFYILLFLLSFKLIAQNPELDNTFNIKDNGVYQQNIGSGAVVLPNNKILSVFGNGFPFNTLRLNPDGSLDKTFNTTDSFTNKSIRIFAKSDGAFLTLEYDGKLKAFNPDGTLNTFFTICEIKTTSSDPLYITVIYQEDGKVVIFGNLNIINGNYVTKCVRLNADGTVDTTFKLTTGGDSMTIQSDGKYIFSSGPKISRYHTDGKIDTTFKVYTTTDPKQGYITNGFETANNSRINDALVQPDGKIIVVGCNFVENAKTISYSIVRLNADGSRDTSFKLFTDKDTRIYNVYLQKDNKIIINSNDSIFIRLNTDGTIDPTFKYSNTVSLINEGALFFQGDKIIISADFKDSEGITRSGIHRINADGSLDLTFNPHSGPNLAFDNTQYDLATKVLLDQKSLLVGNFTTYNDIAVRNICRINQNGDYDPTFKLDPTVKIYAKSAQNSFFIIPQNDGKILLKHHDAISVNGVMKSLIRLNNDGSLDNSFNFNDSKSSISKIKLLENGKILLMGDSGIFVKAGTYYGTYVNTVVQLNTDGSIDTNFNGVFNQKPVDITLLADEKILISFYRENNVYPYESVIKFNKDGTKDASFKPGFSTFYRVKELSDGKLLAIINDNLTRLNTDGTPDKSFTPYSIAKTYTNKYDHFDYYQNGQITLFFSTYSTNSTAKLTLDSEGKLLNTIVYKTGSEFEIQNCEDLLFYGYFSKIEDVNKNGIVRYKTSNTTSNPNPSGEIFQPFTNGQTLQDLKISGSNIKWYATQTNCGINKKITKKGNNTSETALLPFTLLVDGTTYYASQSINGIESSYRLPVTVYSRTLGIKNNDLLPNLRTYPNPIKDYYTLFNNEIICKVEIFNTLGQLIQSKTYDKNDVKIDFTTYNSGLYFLKIYSEDKTVIIKTIKN